MLANEENLQNVIYQVGLKFKEELHQKAFGLVAIDKHMDSTEFHICYTASEKRHLIAGLRKLADYLED